MSIACERVNYWVIESWRSQKVGGQIEKERQRSRGKFSIVTTIQSEGERGGREGTGSTGPGLQAHSVISAVQKALLPHYLVISASIYSIYTLLCPIPFLAYFNPSPPFSLIWNLPICLRFCISAAVHAKWLVSRGNQFQIWKRRVKGGEETERGVRVWNGSEFHLHTATANLH